MKTDELQIGDWVQINRDGLCIKKGTIVEVRGIDGDNKFLEKDLHGVADCRPLDKSQFQGGIWCEYLDPIPLTPEILEKNGFEKDPESGELIWTDDIVTEVIWYGTILTIRGEDANAEFVTCMFVHQLQHALRLCGIEKEIAL